MLIELSKIKPSPNPVRTSWDEDKMEELAQSIKEQGLIVPVKVRPTDNAHYELVYGHRRAEAARRAGLYAIEATVEGVDDTNALIQGLIENVQREDMEPIDTAKALQILKRETGWSNKEIERRGIMSADMVGRYIAILDELPEIQDMVGRHTGGRVDSVNPLSEQHIRIVRQSGLSPEERKPIFDKVANEGLSHRQAGQVAEAVAVTKDPAMRERLINAPYSPYTHDPEMARERAATYGAHDPMARDKTPSAGAVWEATTEVKMMLDYLQTSRKMAEEAIKMAEMGKFAPEARGFVARKARLMVDAWTNVIEILEESND